MYPMDTDLLPPATKLGQGYVFTGVCHSVQRGGVPDQVHPPGPGTPRTRYTPQDQVHPPDQVPPPPRPGTPHTRYTPPDQVHPPGTRYPPPDQVPSPHQVHPPGTRYSPPDHLHPPDQVHPPPRTREIRSTCGRYASYWNAILF